ncbi:hypothetical protein CH281_25290 [Rhodococcus sp. 06-221-2]|nr:hypothetical protein CH281_25290 [Rhodococcus sp. 06-221-2]
MLAALSGRSAGSTRVLSGRSAGSTPTPTGRSAGSAPGAVLPVGGQEGGPAGRDQLGHGRHQGSQAGP